MSLLLTSLRYFRTVSHLKPIQIYARFWFLFYKPRLRKLPAPKIALFEKNYILPAVRSQSMVNESTFLLLNEFGDVNQIGWQDDSRSKLWRYNQHYFDDLSAAGSRKRIKWHVSLINRWIKDNPPASGCGWEPYPTSLRIINWIKWLLQGNEIENSVICSLATQVRWLEKRVEWHLLGNHLLTNAKALLYAGLFFEGKEAQSWLTKGMKILKSQVSEQILADGAQFELSPMYHALAVEDVLDIVNICEANLSRLSDQQLELVKSWKKIVPKALNWLLSVSHPDGDISFFNDAAFGIAPKNIELFEYAKRLDIKFPGVENGLTDLKNSGMIRMQSEDVVLIADLAEIGASYIPGHAHADTLSFELSIFGKRLFVNSGTSIYTIGQERHRQRSTISHNTVNVSGVNTSEVWSGFRVGARAKIIKRDIGASSKELYASATHNGYFRNFSGLLHNRTFKLQNKKLIILDQMNKNVLSEARFYLHPDAIINFLTKESGLIFYSRGKTISWSIDGASSIEIQDSSWHPEFSLSKPNLCLVAKFDSKFCSLILDWM